MAKSKPVRTAHRAVGFIAVRKLKEPRIIWKELEARGVRDVASALLATGDRIVGLAGKKGEYAFVFADASGLHTTQLARGPWDGCALNDAGDHALVVKETSIAEVDIPSGASRTLEREGDEAIAGAAYAGDDIALLVRRAEHHALLLMSRSANALAPITSLDLDEFVFGFGGRDNVLVIATDEKETSRVIIVRDRAFHDAGKIKQAVNTVQTCGAQLLVSGMPGTFEVDLADIASPVGVR